MKVLSVDFDYFQKVTEEQLALYPDGVDNSTSISEVVWSGHYLRHGEKLNKIGIMEDEFETLKRILLSLGSDCPVMVVNSHKHIYNFVDKIHEWGEPLSVVNVDMHHDFVNDNDELDCGNWASYFFQKQQDKGGRLGFRWIANPISVPTYGIENDPELEAFRNLIMPSLKYIEGKEFDIVFLCRSDTWTPPHLDGYFTELCDLIKEHFDYVKLEKGIDKPRTSYLEIAKKVKGLMNFAYER